MSTADDVSLAEVYGLLLTDIRRNRAARQAREAAQVRGDHRPADDEPPAAGPSEQDDAQRAAGAATR